MSKLDFAEQMQRRTKAFAIQAIKFFTKLPHKTGASLVFGRVTSETPLTLESRMAENGVIFSDGIEKNFLEFNPGRQAVIGLAERRGALVI